MNAFAQRHSGSIRFGYSCFDRMLLNAVIQVLQSPANVVWVLRELRGVPRLSREYFRSVSVEYHQWVEELAGRSRVPIVTPPKGVRRDDRFEPFYRRRRGELGVVVILKCRENARVAISRATAGQPHIEMGLRFVWQYYFYLLDADWDRMFLRICPYFPFNALVCVNGHEWLAWRMRAEGIRFRRCGNAFLTCSDPERLQQLSGALSPQDLWNTVLRWLSILIPFFTDRERCSDCWGHRLFVSQAEYCTNLIFHRRTSLDGIMERLLDLNRAIDRPGSLSVIFGKRITKRSIAGLKPQITDGGAFRTKDLHEHAAAQGKTTKAYTLSQLRYDLGKLCAKGLVQKVAGTQTYRLAPEGYRLCVLFLKLFHKIYDPLASATLCPLPSLSSASPLPPLDTLYAAVDRALQELCTRIGLKLDI